MAFNYRLNERLPDLPAPPREFFLILRKANAGGFWLKHCRDERHRREIGSRYYLTPPNSRAVLFHSDSLDTIEAFINRSR
jgi:hypothetical protein